MVTTAVTGLVMEKIRNSASVCIARPLSLSASPYASQSNSS